MKTTIIILLLINIGVIYYNKGIQIDAKDRQIQDLKEQVAKLKFQSDNCDHGKIGTQEEASSSASAICDVCGKRTYYFTLPLSDTIGYFSRELPEITTDQHVIYIGHSPALPSIKTAPE